jgi:DNA-binding Lrp family transcriptional regulator
MKHKDIRIDVIDRRILLELDKDCRQSDKSIGRKVGKSREAVRYRIKQLEKNGVIDGYITTINPNKFGYHLFKIFLQVANIEEERQRLIQYLETGESVYWMGQTEGNWDMIFATYAKDQVEFFEIKNDLLTRFRNIIVKMATGELVDVRQYPKNFLLPDEFKRASDWDKTLLWGGVTAYNELDAVDKRIILLLSNNARMSVVELAGRVNTTAAIVMTKLKNLEQKNILQAYRVALDLNKLGLQFFKAIIYLKQLPPDRKATLYEYVRNHPKMVYLIRTFTPWELELEFVVESYQECNGIVSALRAEFADVINNYELVIVYKESWFPAYRQLFE